MNALRFYTTAGCTLCDKALEAVRPVAQRLDIELHIIDIMDDPALEQRLGERIPVVERRPDGKALGWPFTAADVYRLAF